MIDVVNYLPKHNTLRYQDRPTGNIKFVIVHHSADEGDPWGWARYHVDHHGWPGIGYHAAVMRDGTVLKTNLDRTLSYHAGGAYNPISVGICFQGDLSKRPPTVEQLAAGLVTVNRYVRAYNAQIKGHGEVMQTACPGAAWLVDWLRRAIT